MSTNDGTTKDFDSKMDQIELWMKGVSIHSPKFGCCPDHSCCILNLNANEAVKNRYYRALCEFDVFTVVVIQSFFTDCARSIKNPYPG